MRWREKAFKHLEQFVAGLYRETALHLCAGAEFANLLGARRVREITLLQLALHRSDHTAFASDPAAPRPRSAHEPSHQLQKRGTRKLV